ncbi:unnamed protein product [Cochlearia groenlandica]
MSSLPKSSSAPSRSASGPNRKKAGRSAGPDARPFQDNSRLSPNVGSATDRSYKLKPQKKENADAMLTLDDFPGVFDDELNEEFRVEEEEEGKSDSELGSASTRADLPPMPEGSPRVANEAPLPSGTPPAAIIPPPPADDSSFPVQASPSSQPKVGVKRGREMPGEGSA